MQGHGRIRKRQQLTLYIYICVYIYAPDTEAYEPFNLNTATLEHGEAAMSSRINCPSLVRLMVGTRATDWQLWWFKTCLLSAFSYPLLGKLKHSKTSSSKCFDNRHAIWKCALFNSCFTTSYCSMHTY